MATTKITNEERQRRMNKKECGQQEKHHTENKGKEIKLIWAHL